MLVSTLIMYFSNADIIANMSLFFNMLRQFFRYDLGPHLYLCLSHPSVIVMDTIYVMFILIANVLDTVGSIIAHSSSLTFVIVLDSIGYSG